MSCVISLLKLHKISDTDLTSLEHLCYTSRCRSVRQYYKDITNGAEKQERKDQHAMTDLEIEGAIEGVRCRGQNLNMIDTREYIAGMLDELLALRRSDRARIAGLNVCRFENVQDALKAFEEELTIMHHAWCAISWLMCEYSPDRLTYLRNLEKFNMSTVKMAKEIKKLEKTASKTKEK